MFDSNSRFLYALAIFVIAFILVQSGYFFWRAWRRAAVIGMDKAALKKVVVSTAVFTIAPAVAILLGVITLTKFLGIPLPWIRLSVIGAITYELPAATTTAQVFGISLSENIRDPRVYSAIAWVMTLGIIPGPILVPILQKRIRGGLVKLQEKDNRWSEIFMDALFLGMISAFLGLVFAPLTSGTPQGFLPLIVMLVSLVLMLIMGALIKIKKITWLQNYALPISMLGSMAAACIIAPLL